MRLYLLLALLVSNPAPAGEAEDTSQSAAQLLSHYSTGHVPVDPSVMQAIADLGETGTAAERPLLASLVRHERAEIRSAAITALHRVRSRLRTDQRESFAASLPNWPDLAERAEGVAASHDGAEGRICAAYARYVFGDHVTEKPSPQEGDAMRLLETGQPHRALAAAAGADGQEARLHEAMALEEIGEVRGAIRHYTVLAATGNEKARSEIDGFGIDTERLLLGLLTLEDVTLERNEAQVLDLLVRSGDGLTVKVLSERALSGRASDRATAADALVRMLDDNQRDQPLPPSDAHDARRALKRVAVEGPAEIREIARQGL